MKQILHIDASGREASSTSRQLSAALVQQISGADTQVTHRDVSQGLPFLNEQMIGAYYTPKSERTAEQKKVIAVSDAIVAELMAADAIVIGMPVYNFSMPAGFKAWSDLAARVGETFRYTDEGPVGLLTGKKAYVTIASGGTKVGSAIDFLTPWLKHFLGFIGIVDVAIIEADAINSRGENALNAAREAIAAL